MVSETEPAQAGAQADKAQHLSGHVHLADIAIGVVIGRASEFFEFFVFAIACVLVFPYTIFPFVSPVEGTLYAFAVLALGFLARPVGTLFFTEIDRRYGRATRLTIALFLMGLSTVAISFLPSYEAQGWLVIASLCLFRCGQGAALGGSWDGTASLLALNSPPDRRGRYATLPQIGAPLGLILAASLYLFLIVSLSDEDFLLFGWRYPFFVTFAINVVALFARLRLTESVEFKTLYTSNELAPARTLDVIREEWQQIIIGAFTPLASLALFHMVTVFPLSWIMLNSSEHLELFIVIEIIAATFGLVAILASGPIADRIGRRRLLLRMAIAIAIFAVVSPLLLGRGGIVGEALYVLIGFILLGLSFGQSSGATASGTALKNRYTASAMTTDLAWLFGAGFAPFVALYLSEHFGIWLAGGYLLSGAVATVLALSLFTRRNEERREHDASWR
ncbi:MFS transporter [Granulosicoccus antarcticus]|uniref:Inner membrane metabolite transport protein YhjE n=1 Tax=Granulosicoccus antarcticus IMCC3135 TaxID=1192854 RepID=A0A2Z2P0A5_9GAMM|nr:MFS transporter [Granulosicoccus antarcticus]ASJ75691.1 Inner membrane metabolite transport protein YhjE [Granulosicoccus antarcticus IMCC3135]